MPADTPQVQYRKAHEAIKAENWEQARRLLLGLWARAHTYDVSSSLVYVEYQAHHYAAAANYAAFALRNAPPVESPDEIDRLRRALDELEAQVGSITIVVSPPGAEIKVDAEVVGTSPLAGDVYVNGGTHYIEARLRSGIPASTRVEALAGQTYRVALAVQPEQVPAVESSSRAGVTGRATDAPLEPGESRNYTPAALAASIGALGLAGGVVSFVVSANKHASAEERLGKLEGANPCGPGGDPTRSTECAEIRALADGADTFRALGFVGLGTALAGGALTYALWPRASAADVTGSVSPAVYAARDGVLATVRGEF